MDDRSCRPGGPRAASGSAPERRAPIRDARFPRSRRLTRSREFTKLFAESWRSHDSLFVVLFAPNGLGHPRLGMAISRRRVPLAHERNRVRRLVRESFRLHQGQLGGFDFVVMAQGKLAASDDLSRQKSLEWHWNHLATRCSRFSAGSSGDTSAS